MLARAMELHRRGQIVDAEQLYKNILTDFPRCIDALHFRGIAAVSRGALQEGIALLRQAVCLHPRAVEIQCNLAKALIAIEDATDAITCCDAVIALDPTNVDAWFLRGNARQAAGLHGEAIADYDQALRYAPNFAPALNNKAHSLREMRRPSEALTILERALALQPDYSMALNNRGLALLDLGGCVEALASFDAALRLQPGYIEVISNRGAALMRLKRFGEAAATFARLDAAAPGFEGAIGGQLFALKNCCEWQAQELLQSRLAAAVARGQPADVPLSFLYASDLPSEQLQCAVAYVHRHYRAHVQSTAAPKHRPSKSIRVAYLSGDFGEHAVSYLLAGVIERHDRERIEPVGIGWGRQSEDGMRRRMMCAFSHFVDATNLSDAEIAQLLRDSEIDIAVDLMGHTQGQRTGVFARRAAPIQVNFLGYPGTLGADFFDYLIADSTVIPPGEERNYREHLVRFPFTCIPADNRRPIAEIRPTREDESLPASGFVFCAFGGVAKLTREMFHLWLQLLADVPGSVLWLRTPTDEARANLERETLESGLNLERLVFAETVPTVEQHLARHRLADLYLDTLPYNAHSTACDALWAGLPVLTCLGRSFAGRVGASLLHAVGLSELITESPKEYLDKALDLALHPAKLAEIRVRLAHQIGIAPLFDTARYTRHLETAYEAMTARQRRGLPAAGLCIDA